MPLLLTACAAGAGGRWVKPGGDEQAAGRAYQECAALTETATRTDADIDQDIAATRGSDLQRSPVLRERARVTQQSNRERADTILGACMQAKGYARNAP
jgi:hypothetical protein